MSPTAATRRIRRARARGSIRTCEQRLFTPRAVNRRARAAARWQGGSASRRSRRSSAFPPSRASPSPSRRSRRTICSTVSSRRSGLRTLVSQPALERTRIQFRPLYLEYTTAKDRLPAPMLVHSARRLLPQARPQAGGAAEAKAGGDGGVACPARACEQCALHSCPRGTGAQGGALRSPGAPAAARGGRPTRGPVQQMKGRRAKAPRTRRRCALEIAGERAARRTVAYGA